MRLSSPGKLAIGGTMTTAQGACSRTDLLTEPWKTRRTIPLARVPVTIRSICTPQVVSASALKGEVSEAIIAMVVSAYARSTIAATWSSRRWSGHNS